MYRNLVNAAWSGLHRTGHGGDTFIFGEIAPRGENQWGVFSGMTPLTFLKAMYCVDSRYRELRGSAAAMRGCPTTAAGSRRFRSQNPALFGASGFSDHPYMRWYPPNQEQNPDPVNGLSTSQYTSLGVIGNFTEAARSPPAGVRLRHALPDLRHRVRLHHVPAPAPQQVPLRLPHDPAYYLNWAEYLSWRNPRLRSYQQYLLRDPLPATKADYWRGFASGIVTFQR